MTVPLLVVRHVWRAGDDAIEISRLAQIFDFTPDFAGKQYRLLEIARDRIAAVMSSMEAYMAPTIKSGQQVPGYTLEQSMGNRSWTIPRA